jgi:hypothetical protein
MGCFTRMCREWRIAVRSMADVFTKKKRSEVWGGFSFCSFTLQGVSSDIYRRIPAGVIKSFRFI